MHQVCLHADIQVLNGADLPLFDLSGAAINGNSHVNTAAMCANDALSPTYVHVQTAKAVLLVLQKVQVLVCILCNHTCMFLAFTCACMVHSESWSVSLLYKPTVLVSVPVQVEIGIHAHQQGDNVGGHARRCMT